MTTGNDAAKELVAHSHDAPSQSEIEEAGEEGIRLGLQRWHESCPCCFSEAYPDGLEAAVSKLKG